MRPYQEQYIENARKVMALSDLSGERWEDVDAFMEDHREKTACIRGIIRENTELLRANLFVVLDDIVSASEEEIGHLKDFAAHLAEGVRHLDLYLHYMIHYALTAYARHWEKRDMLIQELYHTALALFYLQDNMDSTGERLYSWKMGMLFGEAASFIRIYDEIEDPETRGYIHRSMGNLALSYNIFTEGEKKLKAVRRSIQILQDPVYRAKTPSLPWDTYLYKSHQERSVAMGLLRRGDSDGQLIREVMESAEYVWERQMEICRKKGTSPGLRWQVIYQESQYYCGLQPLSYLLTQLEKYYLDCGRDDFSSEGMYGNIFLPALYGHYLERCQEYRDGKKDIMCHMNRNVADYVHRVPNNQLNDQLMRYLLNFLQGFVEYPGEMQQKDIITRLIACRNPDAYVFSRMTAHMTRMLMEKVIELVPGLLVGTLCCADAGDVRERREELLQFAWDGGMLHDAGALCLYRMLLMSARNWMDEESAMYKHHVAAGVRILERCDSTRPFAPIAGGHHVYYDCGGGYPADYDRSENPVQIVTDMVSIAAYVSRVTEQATHDTMPIYTPGEAMEHVRAGAGSLFHPQLSQIWLSMEEELSEYLQNGRREAYLEAACLIRGWETEGGSRIRMP